jgi:hypothetical protein
VKSTIIHPAYRKNPEHFHARLLQKHISSLLYFCKINNNSIALSLSQSIFLFIYTIRYAFLSLNRKKIKLNKNKIEKASGESSITASHTYICERYEKIFEFHQLSFYDTNQTYIACKGCLLFCCSCGNK